MKPSVAFGLREAVLDGSWRSILHHHDYFLFLFFPFYVLFAPRGAPLDLYGVALTGHYNRRHTCSVALSIPVFFPLCGNNAEYVHTEIDEFGRWTSQCPRIAAPHCFLLFVL